MPRWGSILALLLCALLGGAAESWAETPVAAGSHETVPPPSELPASDVEEEEADQPPFRAPTEVVDAVARAVLATSAEAPADTPTPPPPRR